MKQQFSICLKQPNNHLENLSIMLKADTKNFECGAPGVWVPVRQCTKLTWMVNNDPFTTSTSLLANDMVLIW
jgi:hypothetical protein